MTASELPTRFSQLGIAPAVAFCLLMLGAALPLRAQQDSSVALLNAGNALRDSFDYEGAIDRYRRALHRDPNNTEAMLQMSLAYLQTANFDRSMDVALQGTRLQSALLPEFNALVSLNYNFAIIISEYYENLVTRPDSEVVGFRKYNRTQPDGASKIFAVGLTYWSMNRDTIAEECLREAAGLDTTAPNPPLILGLLLLQQRHFPEARTMLQRFLHLDPESFLAARLRLVIENITRKTDD